MTLGKNLWTGTKHLLRALIVPVGMYLLMMLLMPNKIHLDNAKYVLIQAVLPAVLAWGASFNLLIGHRDFSVGAAVLTAAIVGGNLVHTYNLGVPGLIILCPLVGLLASSLTGGLFVLLKIPSMIVSIGVMFILESLSSVVFGGKGISLPMDYVVFGGSNSTLYFGIAVFLLTYFLFNYTSFGFHVRAIGNNTAVARMCGINIRRTRFLSFLCVGFFAGLYAALMLGTSGVQKPVGVMGTMKVTFDAMMCFIVGISVASKTNTIIAIFIGSIYMQLVKLLLIALNFPSTFTQAVIAFFVLIVMCYAAIMENRARRRQHREEYALASASQA